MRSKFGHSPLSPLIQLLKDSDAITAGKVTGQVLYVVGFPKKDIVKVGVTSNPRQRIRSLERVGGHRFGQIFVSRPLPDARDAERRMHQAMKKYRSVGEWFNVEFWAAMAVFVDLGVDSLDSAF